MMGAGLLSVVAGFFAASWTMREILTAIHRSDFVRTEFEVEHYDEVDSILEGRVVATNEQYRTSRTNIVGLDQLRSLEREKRLKGYRAPIWYLPKQGWWRPIDVEFPFRVQSEDEFGQTSLLVLVSGNLFLFGAGFLLIRRSVKLSRSV
jgi:hypothetical protein